jgi:spermidine synthase
MNMQQRFTQLRRRVDKVRYYNYKFEELTNFPADMRTTEKVEINRLDNQILVRYFDEEWGKI